MTDEHNFEHIFAMFYFKILMRKKTTTLFIFMILKYRAINTFFKCSAALKGKCKSVTNKYMAKYLQSCTQTTHI